MVYYDTERVDVIVKTNGLLSNEATLIKETSLCGKPASMIKIFQLWKSTSCVPRKIWYNNNKAVGAPFGVKKRLSHRAAFHTKWAFYHSRLRPW